MSTIIEPTVGRVVWFYEQGRGPLAAIVAHVWSDTCVNLAVFDGNGNAQSRTSVYLVQEGSEKPAGYYAEWMPYQKGQAAKTEAVEKQLADIGTAAA